MNHQMLVLLSKRHNEANPILFQHVLALELLRLSDSKHITEEIIAVLPSHSQFRPKNNLYLDLHGLVFETSIYHWQDQPGSDCSWQYAFRMQYAIKRTSLWNGFDLNNPVKGSIGSHIPKFNTYSFTNSRW